MSEKRKRLGPPSSKRALEEACSMLANLCVCSVACPKEIDKHGFNRTFGCPRSSAKNCAHVTAGDWTAHFLQRSKRECKECKEKKDD